MVRVFKNNVRLKKTFFFGSAFPLQAQLRKIQMQLQKTISKAAPCFRNLCVYEPSALRKKPSNLRRKLCCKRISEKWSECHTLSVLCMSVLWPEVYAQSYSDNSHVHATVPCSTHALAQARPTMSYIPLVIVVQWSLILLMPVQVSCLNAVFEDATAIASLKHLPIIYYICIMSL